VYPKGTLGVVSDLFPNRPESANYLTHWSMKHQYIYVETPKAGCTSIKRVLQLAEVDDQLDQIPGNVHDRQASPVPRISDAPAAFTAAARSTDFFKFCFVRNPYTRILSAYLDKVVSNKWEWSRRAQGLGFAETDAPSFMAFLSAIEKQPPRDRDIHWAPQTQLLSLPSFCYDYIGRFEAFAADFTAVCQVLGLTPEQSDRDYGKRHATRAATKLREYMTDEAIDLIKQMYQDDFRHLGYGWAPIIS